MEHIQTKFFYQSSPIFKKELELLLSTHIPTCCLENLHQFVPHSILVKGTDQNTLVHKLIYTEFDKDLSSPLVYAFRSLCSEWLADLQNQYHFDLWAIQRYPSMRFHFPSNVSVFEFHRDSSYNHHFGELNHFLSLTKSTPGNCLYVERNLGWQNYYPLELNSCESAIINTSVFEHGDYISTETFTRVSVDFRALPFDVLSRSKPNFSISQRRPLDCTSYFIRSDQLFNP